MQNRGILQLALFGETQEFVIRNAAPQEERQPRRQFQIRYAMSACRPEYLQDRVRSEKQTADRTRSGESPSRCPCRNSRSCGLPDRSSTKVRCPRPKQAADTRGGPGLRRSSGHMPALRPLPPDGKRRCAAARCIARPGNGLVRSQNFDAGEMGDSRISELDTGLQIGSRRLDSVETDHRHPLPSS